MRRDENVSDEINAFWLSVHPGQLLTYTKADADLQYCFDDDSCLIDTAACHVG
jgi:hypothetical protein